MNDEKLKAVFQSVKRTLVAGAILLIACPVCDPVLREVLDNKDREVNALITQVFSQLSTFGGFLAALSLIIMVVTKALATVSRPQYGYPMPVPTTYAAPNAYAAPVPNAYAAPASVNAPVQPPSSPGPQAG